MIESYLRPSYQRFCVDPFLKIQGIHKVDPSTLSLLSAFLGLSVIPLLLYEQNLFAFFALLLSGFCDTLDGTLARAFKKTSEKGAVIDIMCDRVVEAGVIFGLFLVAPGERAFASVLMLIAVLLCVTSFLVVGIFSKNEGSKSFFYSVGLMERAEAFCFFSLMILFPSTFQPLAFTFAFLVTITGLLRTYEFIRMAKAG